MSFSIVFKQKRFSKWAEGSSLFWTELQILGEARKTSFARDNEKARKSCEYGPENGKQKFNQTRRKSNDTGINISRYLPYILIAMLPFQCFRLDTSFLSVSSKWFGNLRKFFIDKRLINSVKYHYLSLRLVWSLFKKFENKCTKQAQGTNIVVKVVYDWPCFLFANAMTVVTVDFEMAFLSARSV